VNHVASAPNATFASSRGIPFSELRFRKDISNPAIPVWFSFESPQDGPTENNQANFRTAALIAPAAPQEARAAAAIQRSCD